MKIVVGLSGGVDSSLAAALLKEQGHEVLGVTMRLTDTHGAGKDVEDAKAVAEKIGIPFEVWNMEELYDREVVKPFAELYSKGQTPNPCVNCNEKVKLNEFVKVAISRGFDRLATGHYARIEDGILQRAKNRKKDQSYFVASMPPELACKILFPLGDFESKEDVRKEAQKRGLVTAEKKDSADICFLQEGMKKSSLLEEMIAAKKRPDFGKGNVKDLEGNVIGKHEGFYNFTIGQRGGLDLKNPAKDGKPRYVVKIDPETATVFVGSKDDLTTAKIHANNLRIFRSLNQLIDSENCGEKTLFEGGENAKMPVSFRCRAQIRHRSPSVSGLATISEVENCICGENEGGACLHSHLELNFTADERDAFSAVAAGQSVVLYSEDDQTVLAKATLL